MSKYKRLGRNIFLVFLGNVGSKLIGFLMIPFYTKWLSVEEYGTSDNILIYVSLLLTIVTLSISDSIFIFPKDQEINKQKEYFSSGLLYSAFLLFVTGLVLYCVKEILIAYKALESIVFNIGYIYLLIIAFFLQNFFQQFSQSINKLKVYTISGVLLTFLTAFFSFILIPKYAINGFFIAQILSLFIAAIYSAIHSGSYRFFSLKAVKFYRYSEMARYSIPLIPNAVMWWLVSSLNRPLMEEYLGMHAIGIFAVANKIPTLVNVLFSVFMVSWQISVIEEYKKEGYEKFYNSILKIVFAILVFCIVICSVLGETIIKFIVDAKFVEAYRYVPLLCFSVLFSSISGFIGVNFSASRESKYFFYSSICGAFVAIVFNLILIPVWGLYGAVFTIVLSHLVMVITRIGYSWKTVKITNVLYYILLLLISFIIIMSVTFIDNPTIVSMILLTGSILFFLIIRKDILIGTQSIKAIVRKRK